jgi:hypothetical protein
MLRNSFKRPRTDGDDRQAVNGKPPISIMPTIVPGVMQQSYVVSMYQTASNSTSSVAIADGIIWRPMLRGGTSLLRTALAARNTIYTSAPVVPFGFGAFTPTVTVSSTTELMVPVSLSLNGSNFVPKFDVATAFYQSTFRRGTLKLRCNSSGVSSSSIISGTIGAALLGDTRGVYSFDRGVIANKCLFGANVSSEPISKTTSIDIPPFSPAYGQTKHVSTNSRGSLITMFTNISDDHNCVFISHVATSSICTSVQLSEIPWGATPNFTVHYGASTLTTPTAVPVRILNLFAYMDGAGAHVYSVSSSAVAITSASDTPLVDIPEAVPPNSYCIWIGAFILLGLAELVPINIKAWLPFDQETANSYAVVARIDGAAADAMISVEGNIFTQCATTSSSYYANVSTVDVPTVTPAEQFTDLRNAVLPNNTIITSEC